MFDEVLFWDIADRFAVYGHLHVSVPADLPVRN